MVQALPQERIHELLLELPSRWEKLGDLALLPRNFMTSHEWGALQQPPWKAIADALGVKRLAAQAPVANTGRERIWPRCRGRFGCVIAS